MSENRLIRWFFLTIATVVFSVNAHAYGAAQEMPLLPIENAHEVVPGLWRGAAPNIDGLEQLAKHGCKTIIDLRVRESDEEAQEAEILGMRYVHLPLGYMGPSRESINKFLKIVTDKANTPVFVHCRRGEDRTGTLVGVYRMVVQNWSFDRAYKEMRDHHFRRWFFALRETVEESRKNFARPQHDLATELVEPPDPDNSLN